MKQTKQFLRPLLMAIVMLVGMLMPKGAWAEDLWLYGETVTISSDASYESIEVNNGGFLIINEGVTLTVTSSLYIKDGNIYGFGTVINYGTIKGDGHLGMQGGVLANHGHIELGGSSGHGTFTFYNTGTLGGPINLSYIGCDHDEYDNLGTVEATCTHGAGTQYRCKTCYYMRLDETSGALSHNINSHNGINICSSCGHKTYDAPTVGEGSEEDPYQIANAGNLYWFADYTRNENNYANAILTADIVLNDGTFDADGTFTATGADEPSKPFPWFRIGDAYGLYYGTFDGNGHTISGMYVNGRFGLFYTLAGSVVNLGIVNCYIRDNSGTGAICCWNYGTISNCYTTGILSGSYSFGICDQNNGTISNCYSTCSFVYDTDFYGGGICGTNLGTISNCYTSYDTAIQDNAETVSEVYGGVSADRFASGEIAYKLNGSVDGEGNWTAGATDGKQKWYQKLGENGDSYPVLAAAEGNTVYYGYENCLSESETYSNDLRFAEKENAHDWEEYGEHVHKCNICELETDHDWGNGDSKCAVCGYECQHKVEDDEVWDNGVCTICGKVCQHEFEPVDDGYEEGYFIGHICRICDFEEEHDFSNKDGKCTACGYVCEHKTGNYEDEHTHHCYACDLSVPHIIDEDEEHLYYSVYTEDDNCVDIYPGAGRNEISVKNYDELESLKFKVYSLCKVCSDGHTYNKAYAEDFFVMANYNDIDCSESASLDVIIYKRVDDEDCPVAQYILKVSISNPSHKWENGVCSRCEAECEHDFSNKTLTAEPDEHGLYAYVCDNDCGVHGDYNVVKAGDGESATTIELTANTDGETTTYTATAPVTLTDAGGFASPVPFTAASITYTRSLASGKWGTLCLPYALSAKAGYEYFQLSDVSGDAVTLSKIEGTVAAGTPVLVRQSDSDNLSLTETNVLVGNSTNPAGAIEGLQLLGTFVPTPVTSGYYLDASDGLLHSIDEWNTAYGALSIPAFRAWFASSTPSGARSLGMIIDDDEAASLDALRAALDGTALIYGLDGQLRSELRKGVNVVNGKKVIVK